ncbi:MAG: cupin domain-containing protein [Patescibacteria group bacterium UBA2103]
MHKIQNQKTFESTVADDSSSKIWVDTETKINLTKEEGSLFFYTFAPTICIIDKNKINLERGSAGVLSESSVHLKGTFLLLRNLRQKFPSQIHPTLPQEGKLAYINEGRDTILIHPYKQGVACLNIMYFPPGVIQEEHTHPSFRVGIVVDGEGLCVVRGKKIPIMKDSIIYMDKETPHNFYSKTNLTVITYHPDSNFGPTDHIHPMINKTIVQNKPVLESKPEIHTKN